MAQLTPTAPITPVAATASPQANMTPVPVTVTSLPDVVQQIARQIDVSGLVTQSNDPGIFTLTTALGTISFSLAQMTGDAKQQATTQLMALTDSQKPITLVLQTPASSSQGVLLLPTPNNTAGTAPAINTPLPQSLPFIAQPAVPSPPTAAPILLNAVVLPASTLTAASPAIPANATPLTPTAAPATAAAPVTIASSSATPLTATGPSVAPPASAPLNTAIPASIAPAIAPPAAASPATLLQPGNQVTLQINAVATPTVPLPAAAANQIAATVVNIGPQGQAILKAGDATLYVKQPIDVPVGSTILITVEASKGTPPALLATSDNNSLAPLQSVFNALAQANPPLANQIMQNLIPQPNAQLSGAVLLFFGALKQGDARSWLGGNATEILTKLGKASLINKLTDSFRQAGQTVQDGTVGEWQLYPVPINANSQLQMLNLYVHRDPQHQSAAPEGGGKAPTVTQTRFLIDVQMTRLGAIQLDGLTQGRKLDMIVRSEKLLPQGLPNELREVYINAISALGYTGSLNFQTGRQHWLIMQKTGPQSMMS